MTDAQVEDIKAGKLKLMNSAQAVFSKVYEAAQGAANAQGSAGAQGTAGAAGGNAGANNDDAIDGDFKEV